MTLRAKFLAGAVTGVLVLGLAACGDDDGGDDSTSTTDDTEAPDDTTEATTDDGGTVPADEYVDSVCTSVTDWANGLEATVGSLEELATRDEVLGALDELQEFTDTLVDEIDSAGVPDVADGPELSASLATAVDGLTAATADARVLAETLTDDDASANTEIAAEIRSTLSQGFSPFEQLFLNVPPSLQEAFEANSTCTTLVGV